MGRSVRFRSPGLTERGGKTIIQESIKNHIVFVVDTSLSMTRLREQLITVLENQIAYLARRSQELNQETRVTVYTFDSTVQCIVYDTDVLRLPPLREHIRMNGNTALIDATLKSQSDLALTPEIYGDHAFLTYVLTDGEENISRAHPTELANRLATLPVNWTIGVFVPNQMGVFEAKKFGFPADNIAVWNTDEAGLTEVGETIRRTTDTYMQNRATGVRGTRNLFSTGVDALNTQTVKAAKLTQLSGGSYRMLVVQRDRTIKDFVEDHGLPYQIGRAYYQLTKTESIQAGKQVAVMEKASGKVYVGHDARNLLGLPAMNVRVKPDHNPLYDVFVQSTSVNRKLIGGTKLLVLI